jgi:RHS repeat-associated protein
MLSFRLRNLFVSVLLLAGSVFLPHLAQAEVLLPNGEFTTSVEDLRVKVLGGYVIINRTWANSQWYVNPAWADLKFTFDNLDGSVKAIDRGGASFARSGNGIYIFDLRFFIKATATGYQWYDRQGNTIDYDASGKIQGYADRNGVKVTFTYDGSGQRSQVLDHFGNLVLSFGYTGAQLSSITDRINRTMQYQYSGSNLSKVIDVLGNISSYTYDGNNQLLTLTDQEGRITTLSYAVSIPAPVGGAGLKVYTPKDAVVSAGTGISTSGSLQTYKVSRVGTLTDPLGRTTTYQYDYDRVARQYTLTVVTPAGVRTVGIYNVLGRLLQQTVGTRIVSKLGFDVSNVEISTDERGLTTTVQYDTARKPLSITYPDGTKVTTTYDVVYSKPLLKTDEAGVQTKYEYDGKGNLLAMTEALGLPEQRLTTYTYDQYGQLLSTTRKGATSQDDATIGYAYDSYGNATTFTDALQNQTICTYDAMGNPLTKRDARSNTMAYSYNAMGWPTSVTDALNHPTAFVYDKVGNRTKMIDALAYPTTSTYDGNNRLTQITDALGGITRTEFDADGRRTKNIDPSGVTISFGYDTDGRLTRTTDGNGNVISYDYGAAGSGLDGLLTAINYLTYREEYKYDQRSRQTQVIQVLDASTRYTRATGYDGVGNAVSQADAAGRSTLNKYDTLRRLTQITDPAGGVTQYSYNTRDNLLSITDANGNTTRYGYDLAGRGIAETRPQGEVTQTAYDPVGNLTVRTDAKGQQRRYTYDAANRRTREEHYGISNGVLASTPSQTITYAYDARNQLTGYADGDTSASYIYDAMNRKTTDTVNYGTFTKATLSDYFPNGRKKSFAYADGALVTYTYDANGQIKTIATPGGTISYDSYQWTSPKQISLPGATRTMTYDPLLRPIAIKVEKGSAGSGQLVMDYRYTYDSVSNILQRQTQDGVYTYAYDNLDRLTQATPPASLNLPNEQYSYDGVHNRLSSAHQPGAWTYNANNQLQQFGSGSQATTLQYDADGHTAKQVQNGQETNYQYNVAERLVAVTDASTTPIATYTYDPLGRRIKKVANGQTVYFQYADEGLVAEYDATGAATTTYGWQPNGLWGTNPQFTRAGSNTYFYTTDHLGTAQALTDGSGNTAWRMIAEAFGKSTVNATATVSNNLRFPGQYYDAETGLNYNYFRDYDSTIGRYVQSDPVGLKTGVNTYGYVDGNPLSYTDPFGLETYACTKPLHALGQFGQWVYNPSMNDLFHEFLCVKIGDKIVCGGQDRSGGPYSPGKQSDDTFNKDQCKQRNPPCNVDDCVKKAVIDTTRPFYGLIGPGTNCQEWAEDVYARCVRQCQGK